MKKPKKPRAPTEPKPHIVPTPKKYPEVKTLWHTEINMYHTAEVEVETYYENFDESIDVNEQWEAAILGKLNFHFNGRISLAKALELSQEAGKDPEEVFIGPDSSEDHVGIRVYYITEVKNPWYDMMMTEEKDMRSEFKQRQIFYQQALENYEQEIDEYAAKQKEYLEWKKAQIEQELKNLE